MSATTEQRRNTPRHPALSAAIEIGRNRHQVEAIYLEAREAFIEASRQLDRYGKKYAQRIAAVPKGIDLSQYAETAQEPMTPLAPLRSDMEWSDE